MPVLDTSRASATDVLAEAWHAVGVADGDHPLRACRPQSQADVWSDVAQWATFLGGQPLSLGEGGVALLAEAMHADCLALDDHRPHALVACPSEALRESLPRDARLVLAWLDADPARTAGALR